MTPPIILAARAGFNMPGGESFYGPPIWKLSAFGVDLSINRTIVIMTAAAAIVTVLFVAAFSKPKLVPRGLQNVMEYGVEFVRKQVILTAIGPAGLPFLPYLTTLFFFIFFCNIFEIIPFLSFPATSRLAIPMVLAILSWVIYVGVGIKKQGFGGYIKSSLIPPGAPALLLVILIPLEFLSVFLIRPITLAIRLTVNMIVGHLLLTMAFLGTTYLLGRDLTIGFGGGTVLVGTTLVGFEIFVAGLQAYVFTILTAVYIASSLEPAH